ncbi:HEAT repeat domain-containing protein [bacterium]|nr:HEAT repeat domain-containing protein [candidate division CSSED10-310 bacterium]
MGLFDLLRKKKLPPGDPKTQKAGVRLINKNVEAASRFEAADDLGRIGTGEALRCLLQRFTVVIGGATPDEDEKDRVRKILIQAGSNAIEPILRFLKEEETVGQALEILKELSDETGYLDRLLSVTESFDPFHSKYPDKKIQVFREIGRYVDPRIRERLTPFLEDDDDDIRIAAIGAVSRQGEDDIIREVMIQAILDNDERPRVKLAACDALCDAGWDVRGFRKRIESTLPDSFTINRKGQLQRR